MDVIRPDLQTRVDEASRGYQLSVENILQRAFEMFRKAPAGFIIAGIVFLLAYSNPVTSLLLGGPLIAGFYIACALLKKGKDVDTGDFFRGFGKFLPLFLVHLLTSLIIALGFILLVIPGIYFTTVYFFAHAFVWFYDVPVSEALRHSHRTVTGNFWQIFLILLVVGLLNLLGAMAFGVGLLLTVPFGFCVIFAAFDDIIGIP